jgi:phosphatidylserine decarboxylase
VSFAREGYPFIGAATLVTVAMFSLATGRRSFALWLVAIALAVVTLWVAYFFRDPERTGPRGDDVLIAPADGRVLPIVEVDEPTFVGGRAVRISIFMNVFNVHVNRYPVDGVVRFVHYNPGKFINAAHDKASLENEQMSIGIETRRSRVLVRQIAGLVARRIVTYSKQGDTTHQGARFGIIRFGSRVDIFAPVGTVVQVQPGDHTTAGVTVIARFAP